MRGDCPATLDSNLIGWPSFHNNLPCLLIGKRSRHSEREGASLPRVIVKRAEQHELEGKRREERWTSILCSSTAFLSTQPTLNPIILNHPYLGSSSFITTTYHILDTHQVAELQFSSSPLIHRYRPGSFLDSHTPLTRTSN